MKIDGNYLIKLLGSSLMDNQIIETIDALGLEQPIVDEESEFYGQTSTKDTKDVGVDLTFYNLDTCPDINIACLDKIGWSHDKTVKLPFQLKYSFSYIECCETLGKQAEYQDKRRGSSKVWVLNEKYLLFIHFKNVNLSEKRSIVILGYRDKVLSRYEIINKD